MPDHMHSNSLESLVHRVDNSVIAYAQFVFPSQSLVKWSVFDRLSMFRQPPKFFQDALSYRLV